ncbi:MAG TPA: hypothetical protein VFI42_17425 [Thermomicrobiaceae bacterium]|nr:hypothetical protein [Thermomicrobiaceae bacterium]
MLWQDMLLGRWVSKHDLVAALAAAFGLTPEQISVVDDLQKAPELIGPDTSLLVQRTRIAGDFPLYLSLYPRTAQLRRLQGDRVELGVIHRIAAALQTSILIGAGELGDEQWLLVEPDGTIASALLDQAALDEDRYVLRETHSPAALPLKLARGAG